MTVTMHKLRRYAQLSILAFYTFLLPLSIQAKDYRQASPVNEYGLPLINDAQERINYSQDELNPLKKPEQTFSANRMSSFRAFVPTAAWGYAAFGNGIGKSNIVIDSRLGVPEVVLGGSTTIFGPNDYWHILRYLPSTGKYEQIYVSNYYPEGIQRIAVANVTGGPNNEIVVALRNGQIILYDQLTHEQVGLFNTLTTNILGMYLCDLDSDGVSEIIVTSSSQLCVYSGSGNLLWQMDGIGGEDVIAGQMDSDASLEIATTDGHVVNAATHTIQWTWPKGFGFSLELADIDGDYMEELIAAERWYFVWAYDVDKSLPKWSIPISLDIGAIKVADTDSDGIYELLVGEGQWGSILAFNTVTQALEWSIKNPEHGTTDIAVADVDEDGSLDVVWGAGATSTGADHLYVADITTRTIEWQNIHLDGPFLGPECGDLDGDGQPELVVASWESDSGYGSGRIIVFNSKDLTLRAISDEIVGGFAWTGTHDLKLRDVDGDGNLEILVGADKLYDGVIEIYDFNADNRFSLTWTNATRPEGAPFYSVEAGDIDNDGQMEIIGGVGREHTGASGVFIYVYDYASGTEEWHSLQMGDYWDGITGLSVKDIDGDERLEITGLAEQSGDVYIFDGQSKAMEAILFGDYQTLNTISTDSATMLLLTHNDNIASVMRYDNGGYVEIYTQIFGTGTIDGLTPYIRKNIVIVGSSGTIGIFDKEGGELWISDSYGPPFGKHAVIIKPLRMLISAGLYAVIGFTPN